MSETRARVLDTMTVSYLMRGDPAPVNRLAVCGRTSVLLPQPVIAEIAYGLSRLPPSKRRTTLQKRFEHILAEVPRLEWSDAVSLQFGRIKAILERSGQRIEDFELAIAAHALSIGGIVVTSNVRHFERVPELQVEDWS